MELNLLWLRDEQWLPTQHAQMYTQTVGHGGFATGGWAGDEHDLDPVLFGKDPVGDFDIFPFMTGLADIDQVDRVPVEQAAVQGSDAEGAVDETPLRILLESFGEFDLRFDRNEPGRILSLRILQAETVVEGHQIEDLQVAGRGH